LPSLQMAATDPRITLSKWSCYYSIFIYLWLEHRSKRPLKGKKRNNIWRQLSKYLASDLRRENVSDMECGRITSSNLYRLSIVRKVKQQINKDTILGITEKVSF